MQSHQKVQPVSRGPMRPGWPIQSSPEHGEWASPFYPHLTVVPGYGLPQKGNITLSKATLFRWFKSRRGPSTENCLLGALQEIKGIECEHFFLKGNHIVHHKIQTYEFQDSSVLIFLRETKNSHISETNRIWL